MSKTFPKRRNIFRIVTGNTAGWQVRIERHRKQHSRLFSDNVYGSTDAALEAALAWRDEMLASLPAPLNPAEHLHTPKNQRKAAQAMNRTGVVGIGFTMQQQRSGNRTPYVACHWRDPESGARRSSSFSIRKYGLSQAVRLACERLREGQGQPATKGQLDYMVRKALPQIKKLYAEVGVEEETDA